jgi:hypothetical protein
LTSKKEEKKRKGNNPVGERIQKFSKFQNAEWIFLFLLLLLVLSVTLSLSLFFQARHRKGSEFLSPMPPFAPDGDEDRRSFEKALTFQRAAAAARVGTRIYSGSLPPGLLDSCSASTTRGQMSENVRRAHADFLRRLPNIVNEKGSVTEIMSVPFNTTHVGKSQLVTMTATDRQVHLAAARDGLTRASPYLAITHAGDTLPSTSWNMRTALERLPEMPASWVQGAERIRGDTYATGDFDFFRITTKVSFVRLEATKLPLHARQSSPGPTTPATLDLTADLSVAHGLSLTKNVVGRYTTTVEAVTSMRGATNSFRFQTSQSDDCVLFRVLVPAAPLADDPDDADGGLFVRSGNRLAFASPRAFSRGISSRRTDEGGALARFQAGGSTAESDGPIARGSSAALYITQRPSTRSLYLAEAAEHAPSLRARAAGPSVHLRDSSSYHILEVVNRRPEDMRRKQNQASVALRRSAEEAAEFAGAQPAPGAFALDEGGSPDLSAEATMKQPVKRGPKTKGPKEDGRLVVNNNDDVDMKDARVAPPPPPRPPPPPSVSRKKKKGSVSVPGPRPPRKKRVSVSAAPEEEEEEEEGEAREEESATAEVQSANTAAPAESEPGTLQVKRRKRGVGLESSVNAALLRQRLYKHTDLLRSAGRLTDPASGAFVETLVGLQATRASAVLAAHRFCRTHTWRLLSGNLQPPDCGRPELEAWAREAAESEVASPSSSTATSARDRALLSTAKSVVKSDWAREKTQAAARRKACRDRETVQITVSVRGVTSFLNVWDLLAAAGHGSAEGRRKFRTSVQAGDAETEARRYLRWLDETELDAVPEAPVALSSAAACVALGEAVVHAMVIAVFEAPVRDGTSKDYRDYLKCSGGSGRRRARRQQQQQTDEASEEGLVLPEEVSRADTVAQAVAAVTEATSRTSPEGTKLALKRPHAAAVEATRRLSTADLEALGLEVLPVAVAALCGRGRDLFGSLSVLTRIACRLRAGLDPPLHHGQGADTTARTVGQMFTAAAHRTMQGIRAQLSAFVRATAKHSLSNLASSLERLTLIDHSAAMLFPERTALGPGAMRPAHVALPPSEKKLREIYRRTYDRLVEEKVGQVEAFRGACRAMEVASRVSSSPPGRPTDGADKRGRDKEATSLARSVPAGTAPFASRERVATFSSNMSHHTPVEARGSNVSHTGKFGIGHTSTGARCALSTVFAAGALVTVAPTVADARALETWLRLQLSADPSSSAGRPPCLSAASARLHKMWPEDLAAGFATGLDPVQFAAYENHPDVAGCRSQTRLPSSLHDLARLLVRPDAPLLSAALGSGAGDPLTQTPLRGVGRHPDLRLATHGHPSLAVAQHLVLRDGFVPPKKPPPVGDDHDARLLLNTECERRSLDSEVTQQPKRLEHGIPLPKRVTPQNAMHALSNSALLGRSDIRTVIPIAALTHPQGATGQDYVHFVAYVEKLRANLPPATFQSAFAATGAALPSLWSGERQKALRASGWGSTWGRESSSSSSSSASSASPVAVVATSGFLGFARDLVHARQVLDAIRCLKRSPSPDVPDAVRHVTAVLHEGPRLLVVDWSAGQILQPVWALDRESQRPLVTPEAHAALERWSAWWHGGYRPQDSDREDRRALAELGETLRRGTWLYLSAPELQYARLAPSFVPMAALQRVPRLGPALGRFDFVLSSAAHLLSAPVASAGLAGRGPVLRSTIGVAKEHVQSIQALPSSVDLVSGRNCRAVHGVGLSAGLVRAFGTDVDEVRAPAASQLMVLQVCTRQTEEDHVLLATPAAPRHVETRRVVPKETIFLTRGDCRRAHLEWTRRQNGHHEVDRLRDETSALQKLQSRCQAPDATEDELLALRNALEKLGRAQAARLQAKWKHTVTAAAAGGGGGGSHRKRTTDPALPPPPPYYYLRPTFPGTPLADYDQLPSGLRNREERRLELNQNNGLAVPGTYLTARNDVVAALLEYDPDHDTLCHSTGEAFERGYSPPSLGSDTSSPSPLPPPRTLEDVLCSPVASASAPSLVEAEREARARAERARAATGVVTDLAAPVLVSPSGRRHLQTLATSEFNRTEAVYGRSGGALVWATVPGLGGRPAVTRVASDPRSASALAKQADFARKRLQLLETQKVKLVTADLDQTDDVWCVRDVTLVPLGGVAQDGGRVRVEITISCLRRAARADKGSLSGGLKFTVSVGAQRRVPRGLANTRVDAVLNATAVSGRSTMAQALTGLMGLFRIRNPSATLACTGTHVATPEVFLEQRNVPDADLVEYFSGNVASTDLGSAAEQAAQEVSLSASRTLLELQYRVEEGALRADPHPRYFGDASDLLEDARAPPSAAREAALAGGLAAAWAFLCPPRGGAVFRELLGGARASSSFRRVGAVRRFHDVLLAAAAGKWGGEAPSRGDVAALTDLFVAEVWTQANLHWELSGNGDASSASSFATSVAFNVNAGLATGLRDLFRRDLAAATKRATKKVLVQRPADRTRKWLRDEAAAVLAARTVVDQAAEGEVGGYTASYLAAADEVMLKALRTRRQGASSSCLPEAELQRLARDDFDVVRQVALHMYLAGFGDDDDDAPSRPLLRATALDPDEALLVEMAALTRACNPWSRLRNPVTGRLTDGLALRAPQRVYFLHKFGRKIQLVTGTDARVSRETGQPSNGTKFDRMSVTQASSSHNVSAVKGVLRHSDQTFCAICQRCGRVAEASPAEGRVSCRACDTWPRLAAEATATVVVEEEEEEGEKRLKALLASTLLGSRPPREAPRKFKVVQTSTSTLRLFQQAHVLNVEARMKVGSEEAQNAPYTQQEATRLLRVVEENL